MRRACVVVTLVACRPLPPPPLVPMHADTRAAPEGATTVTLVVGFVGLYLWGGAGLGTAVRIEHQATADSSLGLELGGGYGKEQARGKFQGHARWLVALRGYGRYTATANEAVALAYGAGLSFLDTGLVTASAHGGFAASIHRAGTVDVTDPQSAGYLTLGLAGAWPLRTGKLFGDETQPPEDRALRYELVPYFGVGLIFPGDANALSVDLTIGVPLRTKPLILVLSAAGAHRSD